MISHLYQYLIDILAFLVVPTMVHLRTSLCSHTILAALAFLPSACALILPPALNRITLHPPTNLTWSLKHCVTDPTWNPLDSEIAPSCDSALLAFSDEASIWGPNLGTFTYNKGRSTARFPGVGKTLAIPKRYVSGSCVVAVVMMELFEGKPQWQFPELPSPLSPLPWPSEDQVSWREMVGQIGYVRSTCLNGCGYALVGRNRGIGVVTWGTNTKWDQFIMGILGEGNGTVEENVAIA